jgi:hypothetical protein
MDYRENDSILAAGLGVGLPLSIALLASLFFLFRARREIKRLKGSGEVGGGAGQHRAGWGQEHKQPSQPPVWEAPNQNNRMRRAELLS